MPKKLENHNAKESWIVRVRCKTVKELVCDNCTEEQAEQEPFEHCVDEQEIDTMDWEVISVKPNK